MPMGMMIWSANPLSEYPLSANLTIMEWCLACMGGRIQERLQRSKLLTLL